MRVFSFKLGGSSTAAVTLAVGIWYRKDCTATVAPVSATR